MDQNNKSQNSSPAGLPDFSILNTAQKPVEPIAMGPASPTYSSKQSAALAALLCSIIMGLLFTVGPVIKMISYEHEVTYSICDPANPNFVTFCSPDEGGQKLDHAVRINAIYRMLWQIILIQIFLPVLAISFAFFYFSARQHSLYLSFSTIFLISLLAMLTSPHRIEVSAYFSEKLLYFDIARLILIGSSFAMYRSYKRNMGQATSVSSPNQTNIALILSILWALIALSALQLGYQASEQYWPGQVFQVIRTTNHITPTY